MSCREPGSLQDKVLRTDRTAAEREVAAEQPRRRRRILQSRIHFKIREPGSLQDKVLRTDRTAAEREVAAEQPRRRRRILQSRIHFDTGDHHDRYYI